MAHGAAARARVVGSSSYLFVLSCCEGLGRVPSLVLSVSETMFVAGDLMTWPHGGGGIFSGSEACAGGTAVLPLAAAPGAGVRATRTTSASGGRGAEPGAPVVRGEGAGRGHSSCSVSVPRLACS